MLDLMTLGLSMGAQEDLEKARQESGVSSTISEDANSGQENHPVVETVNATLSAIESAASSAASALLPSAELVANVCESAVSLPQLDLTLPVAPKKGE